MEISRTKHNSRIEWLDIAKGIAIIAMIVGHTVEYGSVARNLIFSFHMPLFFLLSGYTYRAAGNWGELWPKIRKDILRLYVPMAVTLCIYQVVKAAMDGDGREVLNVGRKLAWGNGNGNTFLGTEFPGTGVLWFLVALFFTKLIYGIIQMITKDRDLLVVYILLACVGIFIGKHLWLPQTIDLVLVAMLFFYLGHLMKKREGWIRKYFVWLVVLAAVVWLGMLRQGIYIEMAMRQYPWWIFCALEAVCGSFLVMQFSKCLQFSGVVKKVLVFIGRHTLEILCIHFLDKLFFSWEPGMTLFRIILDVGVMCLYVLLKSLIVNHMEPRRRIKK